MQPAIITRNEEVVDQSEFTHFPATLELVIAAAARLGSSRNRPLIVPLSRRGGYVFSRCHVEDEQYVFRIQPGIHGIEPRNGEDSFEALKLISKSAFYGRSVDGITEPNVYVEEEENYFKYNPLNGVASKLSATLGDRYFLIIRQFESSVEPRILRPIEASGFVPVARRRDFDMCVLFPSELPQSYVEKRFAYYQHELHDLVITYRISRSR